MKTYTLVTASLLSLAAPVCAESSFPEMIANSNGYLNIRENVVLVETDDGGFLCRMDVKDAAFDAQAQGEDIPEGAVSATCIPFEEFEN
ncbi:MAG: hypothetical protein GY767_09245 [Shimia sp.]|nr:hypothetical protein [Shimia sp.]MCP4825187.1 hypothetical protein [Shimia sp.]